MLQLLIMKKKAGNITTPTVENRKARFNYEIYEKYEAGLVLKGNEVKSMRQGKVSLSDSYARLRGSEIYLLHFHIDPYKEGSWTNEDPLRPRKLLLHKREVKRLTGKMQERGLLLIPLKTYFKKGFAKVLLGLGRARKLYDKREKIKKREVEREMGRVAKGGRR